MKIDWCDEHSSSRDVSHGISKPVRQSLKCLRQQLFTTFEQQPADLDLPRTALQQLSAPFLDTPAALHPLFVALDQLSATLHQLFTALDRLPAQKQCHRIQKVERVCGKWMLVEMVWRFASGFVCLA
jgi:hypothetical protein